MAQTAAEIAWRDHLVARLNRRGEAALRVPDMETWTRATKQALRLLGHPDGWVA